MKQYYQTDICSIRREEYPTLNAVTYLDHAGTTLYAQSLINEFAQDMKSNLFGNPHSASPSSALSTHRVEDVRSRLLRFFNADPEHFDLVFVANATAAIKLVVDSFRDIEQGFWYGYHRDAHTSIVGVRQLAREARCFGSDAEVEDWVQESQDMSYEINLFAYPAQSNMNGHRTPLDWPGRIRKSSRQRMYTLLDAAAYVMTAPLDLSDVESAPDFTALSFYKIFGFPDLGALIIRKSAGDILRRRRFFGGGTVDMVIALQTPWHAMKDHVLHEQLEDGTLPFHSIAALGSALEVFQTLFGSMKNVSQHTCDLALNLYSRLSSFFHSNGQRVCHFYKDPTSQYGNAKNQGPTLAFNLLNAQGGWIGKSDVERLAILHGIHIRTGGVCNPGGIASFCDLQAWEMRRNFSEGMRCGDDLDILGGKPTGIIRVGFGAMSSMDDVHRFAEFVQDMFVETTVASATEPALAQDGDLVVEKLQIFPILGCAGLEIQRDVPWSIGSTGFVWDREWCIVSQDHNQPLDPKEYPSMRTITPHLDPEKGTLRLVAHRDSALFEITVCLWDTPTSNHQDVSILTTNHRPFDTYSSLAVQNFFTSHLGTPCTLARFQHPRKVSKEHHTWSPASASVATPTRAVQSTISVAISVFPNSVDERQVEAKSNITLTLPPHGQMPDPSRGPFHYMRIQDQFFQLLDSPASYSREPFEQPFNIKHLPNSKSHDLASQHPTISTKQEVQFFSKLEAEFEPVLRQAISSRSTCSATTCPVWHCRRTFSQDSDLGDHLHTHVRKTRPSIGIMRGVDEKGMMLSKKISHTPSPSTSTTSTTMTGITIGTMDSVDTVATDVSLMETSAPTHLNEKRGVNVDIVPVSLASAPGSVEIEREMDLQKEMEVVQVKKRRWSIKRWSRRFGRAVGCARGG